MCTSETHIKKSNHPKNFLATVALHGIHCDGPPGLAVGINGKSHKHAEFGSDGKEDEGLRSLVVLDEPAVGGAHEVVGLQRLNSFNPNQMTKY